MFGDMPPCRRRRKSSWRRCSKAQSGTIDHIAAVTASSTSLGNGQNTSLLYKRVWLWNGSRGKNRGTDGVNINNLSILEEGRVK